MRKRRPFFNRKAKYVAVRRIRIGPNRYIEPGEPVSMKVHRLKLLHLRRRIGEVDDPWTLQALQTKGFPKPYITDAGDHVTAHRSAVEDFKEEGALHETYESARTDFREEE